MAGLNKNAYRIVRDVKYEAMTNVWISIGIYFYMNVIMKNYYPIITILMK